MKKGNFWRNLFGFGRSETGEIKRQDIVDTGQGKVVESPDSRIYRVVAKIVKIAPTQSYVIGPRRVMDLTDIIPTVQEVYLQFSYVAAACVRLAKDDGALPNLLDTGTAPIKNGWYQIAIGFVPDLVVGSSYSGVVLVQPSRSIKTFTLSPRTAFVSKEDLCPTGLSS